MNNHFFQEKKGEQLVEDKDVGKSVNQKREQNPPILGHQWAEIPGLPKTSFFKLIVKYPPYQSKF